MNGHDTFIFGEILPVAMVSPEKVETLIEEARSRKTLAAAVPLNKIVGILDRVSQKWSDPLYPLAIKALDELPGRIAFSREMVREGIRAVCALCSGDNIIARLRGELRDTGFLENWQIVSGMNYRMKAVPRAPILHLAAGNVFVGAVDSLVSGIITKNVNILKMSRVDTLFPVLFLESIKECDSENLIWPNQALLYWKGGDEAYENQLLKENFTVVFWGGRDALEAIRSRVGPSVRLVENGPRCSFAVTYSHMLEGRINDHAVSGLARDLCMWDQQACSSPHVVYVIGTSGKPVHNLMDRLAAELTELSEQLPIGCLTFDEKVEIRRVRELAKMGEAIGKARLKAPDTFDYTLIYEEDMNFKASCLNRTLFFKSVPSLESLVKVLVPLRGLLQTAGIHAYGTDRETCTRALLDVGVKRITTWGGMSDGKLGAPHEGSFLLSSLVNWMTDEYDCTGKERLMTFINDLDASPFYRKFIPPEAKENFSEFTSIPLLTRERYFEASPPVSNDIFTDRVTDAYVYASGGTTGEPKYTIYSNDEYRRATDILAFIYRAAGVERDDRAGNLFLAGNLWTSFNVAGRALENIGCLNLPIGGATDYSHMIKYIETFKVNVLVGLPSVIIKLAETVRDANIVLPVTKILYGGEHLRKQAVKFLQSVFPGVSVRSAGYACVDTGPVGYQCASLEGTVHHVLDDYQYVEIVDPSTGTSVTGDAIGEIVATNIDRKLMPVVRYRTGDLGRWVEPECRCGYKGRSFELLGRCADWIVIGGINLMPADVAAGLAKLPVSPNFQIVARTGKDGKEILVLRLEAEKKIPANEVLACLSEKSYKIEKSLNQGWMEIEIEWFAPGTLPRNPRTGKITVVTDERY